MKQKRVYKLMFSEEFINIMLNKGWVPMQFQGIGKCVFQECKKDVYECEIIFMNCGCEYDYERLSQQIKELEKHDELIIVAMKGGDSRINAYYIIYEKGKSERLISTINYNNKLEFKKTINLLFYKISAVLFATFCFGIMCFLALSNLDYHWVYPILAIHSGILVLGNFYTIIGYIRIRTFVKYIYSKYF